MEEEGRQGGGEMNDIIGEVDDVINCEVRKKKGGNEARCGIQPYKTVNCPLDALMFWTITCH